MTASEPHPLRCQTCENKDCDNHITTLWFYEDNDNQAIADVIKNNREFVEKYGCASHSAAQQERERVLLECRDIVFNRVVYGTCPYNGDCGQCFLCDNAGGCIVITTAELRQQGEQKG